MAKQKNADLLVNLEIEKSKLNREKSILVLDKALMLYFVFLFVAVVGFINRYISPATLNLLVLMSMGVLVVGIAPYWVTMRREEKRIDGLIMACKNSRGGGNHA